MTTELLNRKTDYPVHPLIKTRWSARAMSGETISEEELMSLFEAARFAPSSYNNQPWRFVYATRDSKEWQTFMDLMIPFNQSWAKNAAVLLVIVSHKNFSHNNKPAPTHSYDTGAAWMSLSFEGENRGLVVHGMAGFDYEKAKSILEVPDDYQVEAMAAIGKRAPKETMSKELQEKEKPSPRMSAKDFAMQGKFRKTN